MNPSGDFGKKELSPALRNRMTEIWVESYFLQKELIDIYSQPSQISADVSLNIYKNLPDSIDLYLIISKMCEDKLPDLSAKVSKQVSLTLFNMIGFINFTLAAKFSAL
jgi:hypothetical protein